jgi:hypothetical protein
MSDTLSETGFLCFAQKSKDLDYKLKRSESSHF